MGIINKYNNYELHPYKTIAGYDDQAWEGNDQVLKELERKTSEILQVQKKAVLCMDFYPGVDKEALLKLASTLNPIQIFDMEDYVKEEETLEKEFYDYMTEDRVFGVICHKKLEDFFHAEQLNKAKELLDQIEEGLVIVAGVGAGLITVGDIYVYCNMTRWEIQLRYRTGMANWHCSNSDAPILTKYKKDFFIVWRLADRYKKQHYHRFDYLLESECPDNLKLVTGTAFRSALNQISKEPFRLEPYFDPGVWGGHWMQNKFGLDPEKENFAWSFDGVPEENSLNLKYGNITIKVPAIDLVLYCPTYLLGERVHGRFGAEFPIRFDMLDTMGGGNLSLQVHPLTEYIQDTFGMHYTQDESYYFLDTDEAEETFVYLGVKNNVDKEGMIKDLRRAESGEISFPVDSYINKIPVKKHDHVLIPAGTIHCSGKNTMVLEISATPYIFTFKLWDWDRVGLDGLPRPIHTEHGIKNIQWERDTDWIHQNLLHQETLISSTDECKIERTGLHNQEFIDTIRYTLSKPVEVTMDDSVHVMNLIDGKCAWIESIDNLFSPFEIHYAETCIVPASVGKYRIVPTEGEIKVITASVRK